MRKQNVGLMVIAIVGLLASVSLAGTPTVSVYFDEALTMRSLERPMDGLVTVYIVAEGFDADLSAIEYKVDYPAGVTWLADVDMPDLKIGTTEEGIAQAWSSPIDGRVPQIVAKARVRVESGAAARIQVVPNPESGYIRAVASPDHRVIEAAGMASQTPGVATRNEPALYGGKPNPFNPVTQVTFWLPETARARVTVHNVSGQRVGILLDEVRSSGENTVEWDAGDLPSGVYFLRLDVGDFSQNKKVVLLK